MNDTPKLSKSQLDSLIDTASKSSGIESDSFKKAVESSSLDSLLKNLKPGDAKKLQNVLADREAANRLLSTPQAQQLLKKILEEKK